MTSQISLHKTNEKVVDCGFVAGGMRHRNLNKKIEEVLASFYQNEMKVRLVESFGFLSERIKSVLNIPVATLIIRSFSFPRS